MLSFSVICQGTLELAGSEPTAFSALIDLVSLGVLSRLVPS